MTRPSDRGLESVLAAQRAFWRFVGIFTLIILSIYLLIIAFAVVVGVAGWRM